MEGVWLRWVRVSKKCDLACVNGAVSRHGISLSVSKNRGRKCRRGLGHEIIISK